MLVVFYLEPATNCFRLLNRQKNQEKNFIKLLIFKIENLPLHSEKRGVFHLQFQKPK